MVTHASIQPASQRRKLGLVTLSTLVLALGLTTGATAATAAPAAPAAVVKTAAATATAKTAFTKTPVPVITGTARVGSTLTATAGTWAPAPVTLSYQWKRAGVTIPGATGRTYTVRPTDAGAALAVTVTGKRGSFVTVAKQSASTAKAVGLAYKNCTALVAVYPHGVAKAGIKVNLANGVPRLLKGPPFFSTAVYNLNSKSDGDKDGIACER